MTSVLGKVAQLNIKYRKKWGPHNRYLNRQSPNFVGAPPDKVTPLRPAKRRQKQIELILLWNISKYFPHANYWIVFSYPQHNAG